jgi:plastocyanin
MKSVRSNCRWLLVLAIFLAPHAVQATTWHAIAGVQSNGAGIQALAFLANELWVHAGDSITWIFPTPEIHTVTFLNPGQIRPPRPSLPGGGCPGTTASGSTFDGSTCVTSVELVNGDTYTVQFPTAGNFKLVCLVHNNMTGAVHVLAPSEPLPHNQDFYEDQAQKEHSELLADGNRLEGRGTAIARQNGPDAVTLGIGEIVATGGGEHTVSVNRFLQDTIVVRVGDTVEWTNYDPVTPHTVTFGNEPADAHTFVGLNALPDSDGSRHAVLAAPADINSGFLQAAFQDRTGLAQTPVGVTRFRVTFNTPGTFKYKCALHDEEGMVGRVIVHR